MKAMILAAGLGTRLLPYTRVRPKPLFPVLNRPLLNMTVNRLRKAGFTEIIVNCHHLREQIRDALQREKSCYVQEEDEILGTGGGLRLAADHFAQQPVLAVNGDIYHSIDYRDVYRGHSVSGADVTLVLHDYPRFNNVAVGDDLLITGFNLSCEGFENKGGLLAFTGIHVINPEVLRTIRPGTPSCIIDCYRKLLDRGGKIRAHIAREHFWTDMGTPEDYLQLHAGLLRSTIPAYEELLEVLAEAPFVGRRHASIGEEVRFLDWACLGRESVIGPGSTVERSVVWDGVKLPAASLIKDAIITG